MTAVLAAHACIAGLVLVLVVYALRRWVAFLDARLFMDDCIPHAQDVAAHEPTVVARFGYDTDSKEAA